MIITVVIVNIVIILMATIIINAPTVIAGIWAKGAGAARAEQESRESNARMRDTRANTIINAVIVIHINKKSIATVNTLMIIARSALV